MMKLGIFEIFESECGGETGKYYCGIFPEDYTGRTHRYLWNDGTLNENCGEGWYHTIEEVLGAIEKYYQNINNLNNHEVILNFMGFSVYRMHNSDFEGMIYIGKRVPGKFLYMHPDGTLHRYNGGFFKDTEEVFGAFSKYLERL